MKAFLAALGEVLKHLLGSRQFMIPLLYMILPMIFAAFPPDVRGYLFAHIDDIGVVSIIALGLVGATHALTAWREGKPVDLGTALHQMLDAVIKAIQDQSPDVEAKVIDLKQSKDGTWAVTVSAATKSVEASAGVG